MNQTDWYESYMLASVFGCKLQAALHPRVPPLQALQALQAPQAPRPPSTLKTLERFWRSLTMDNPPTSAHLRFVISWQKW